MNVQEVQKPPPNAPAAPTPSVAKVPVPASKMSLKHVRKGVLDVPHRVLIYGAEKVGKSTFAAGAPKPIFFGKDSGTEELDIARMPQPSSWRDVIEGLNVIENEAHDYKTLVLDPINWLEPLASDEVVGNSGVSIEKWDGGYGRGYDAAILLWREFIKRVESIWSKRQMNVIFVAHAQVKKFNDPEGPGYDRWEIEIANKRASGILKQWAATILFARREAFGKMDSATKRAKAYGSAARMMHAEWSPAFDAGNRQCLPAQMPLSWAEFVNAVAAGRQRATEMMTQIEAGLSELGDPEVEAKVRSYLADKTIPLVDVWNALAAKLGEKREQNAPSATAAAPDTSTQSDSQEG